MPERASTGFRDAVNQTGSVKGVMANGIIAGYSGTQPLTADAAETGTLLILFTVNGGAFTPGVPTNGINMGTSVNGVLSKDSGETISGVGLANGVLGWFRWYDNDMVTGISTDAIRYDGQVGNTSSYEMEASNRNIVVGVPATLSTFTYTSPGS
jgi:hypothetical protein